MPTTYQAPGGLTSPVNGTVTLWRVLTTSSGNAHFQVVHPLGANLFTGAGSTPTFVIPGNQLSTYPVAVPIKIGDYPALVNDSAIKIATSDNAVSSDQFQPPLVDGAPGLAPVGDGNHNEITVNAEIEPA